MKNPNTSKPDFEKLLAEEKEALALEFNDWWQAEANQDDCEVETDQDIFEEFYNANLADTQDMAALYESYFKDHQYTKDCLNDFFERTEQDVRIESVLHVLESEYKAGVLIVECNVIAKVRFVGGDEKTVQYIVSIGHEYDFQSNYDYERLSYIEE